MVPARTCRRRTGLRQSCVSSIGAFDMVGNLAEWVADWVPQSTGGGAWSPGVSATGDIQGLAGAEERGAPGALLRGGDFLYGGGTPAGPARGHGCRRALHLAQRDRLPLRPLTSETDSDKGGNLMSAHKLLQTVLVRNGDGL